MEKYFVIGLTNTQVGNGALSLIMDVIRQEFLKTSQRVIKTRSSNGKQQAIIRFENFLTTTSISTEYPDFTEVLYLNEVAKNLLESNGVEINILKEVEEIPNDAGWLISMPIYT